MNQDDLAIFKKESLCIIPIPYREKAANIKWQEFQSRKPTVGEVNKWFLNGHDSNLAVVCGAISGNLVVLDFDAETKFWEFITVIQDKGICQDFTAWTPIVKTSKGYHIYLKTDQPVKSMKFPALDIKGEGGYVIAPPSIHPSGTPYKFINDIFVPEIRHIKDLKEIGIDVEQQQVKQDTTQPGWVTELLKGVGQGSRDASGIKLAGYFAKRMPIDIVETLITDWNKKNSPPLENYAIQKIIASAKRYAERDLPITNDGELIYKNIYSVTQSNLATNVTENVTQNVTALSERIEVWIKETKGRWFETQEVDRELGVVTPKDKDNRRQVMNRLEEKGIIQRHDKHNKMWRFLTQDLVELNYKILSVATPLPIILPLGLSKYINVFAGNLIVIAGSPNAGKTGVALELIKLNNNSEIPTAYFFSEGGESELRSRLDNCEGMDIDEWNFRAFSRAVDFADVIIPGYNNIVDYLEVTDDLWSVGDKLTAICNKNPTGLNVVCLQKKIGARLGRGAEFSLEKARLYIALDEADGVQNCKAEIIKAKSWAIKGYNPNHLKATFHIENGWIADNNVEWTYEV